MIDEEPRRRASIVADQALTLALLNRWTWLLVYQARNSFKAMLETRRVVGEETLSSTVPSTSATGRSSALSPLVWAFEPNVPLRVLSLFISNRLREPT